MIKEAVFHRTDSEMCYLSDNGNIIIIVKAKKNDIAQIVMMYDDRYDSVTKREAISIRLERTVSDELYDYFKAEFKCSYTRLCYYFILTDFNGCHEYLYQNGFSSNYSFGRQNMFHLAYLHQTDAPNIPKWLKESIMYQIFPDSFAQEEKRIEQKPETYTVEDGVKVESKYGGTLRGIKENIPYLKELGINLIYLNPIFTANSYHKYDTVDYYSIDPCFGTKEQLMELVEQCHENGIRIMLDLVFNQSGKDFFAFRDVIKKGEESTYKDWYHIHSFPLKCDNNPNYETFAFYEQMPKFNTDNPDVSQYLIDIASYWVKEFDIDGYRLDVANELSHDFWKTFRRELTGLKADIAIIGEVWQYSHSWISNNQFHSVMNYPLLYAIWEFFGYNYINAYQFDAAVNRLNMLYKWDNVQTMMNFIDTHDVVRFLTVSGISIPRQKLAATFLMTCVGVPMIFYGDEKAMEGTSMDDTRRMMIWQDSERSTDMLLHYKRIIELRKRNSALVYGDMRTVAADIYSNVYGFERKYDDESIYCLFNNSAAVKKITIGVRETGKYFDLLNYTNTEAMDNRLTVLLEPYQAAILKRNF